jgi:hypothetical protein
VKLSSTSTRAATALFAAVLFCPATLRACSACYGQSDSPLAVGMNWGILTLLAVVLSVLTGIAMFFMHVNRRSASLLAIGARASLEGLEGPRVCRSRPGPTSVCLKPHRESPSRTNAAENIADRDANAARNT